MAFCTILSLGFPTLRDRVLLPSSALGIFSTFLTGLKWYCPLKSLRLTLSNHSRLRPSRVSVSVPGVIFPGLLFIRLYAYSNVSTSAMMRIILRYLPSDFSRLRRASKGPGRPSLLTALTTAFGKVVLDIKSSPLFIDPLGSFSISCVLTKSTVGEIAGEIYYYKLI